MNEDNFDDWVKEIQEEIIEKEREIYSEKVIQEYQNPKNFCKLENADSSGKITGVCGDTMEIFLKIENQRISKASFLTDGCGATIACGSMVTQMIEGKKIKEVENLRTEDLIKALEGLPDENLHCAKLAVATVHMALVNYHKADEKDTRLSQD